MISWIDILSIVKIALVIFASCFLLYLPLVLLFRDKKAALQFVIPISMSTQIIFGYIFYCFGWTKEYPVVYFILGAVVNCLAIYSLSRLGKLKDATRYDGSKFCWMTLLLFSIVVFSRFFDSFKTIAPGEIDTYNHVRFLTDLVKQGFLSFPQYAPGFHLFIYPLTFVARISDIYRFTGPIIGIISTLSLFLLLKDSFQQTTTKLLLLSLASFPIFNQLSLQEIGFFSTSLTFIIFPVFAYIIMTDKEKITQFKLLLIYILSTVALSLTVPYLYVQFLPALAVFCLIIIAMRKHFDRAYLKRILMILVISAIGFFVAFGHVYIQTKILKRASSFPTMELARFEDGQMITLNNYSSTLTKTNSGETKTEKFVNSLEQSDIFIKYITPMTNLGRDLLSIKNVRRPKDILSLGAYIWIIFSLILIPVALKLKSKKLLLISTFTVVFGVATQLGILEISTYRGRSGWYLMLLLLIGLVYLYDKFSPKMLQKKWLTSPLIILIGLSGIAKPPVYYRAYYTDPYLPIKNVVAGSPSSSISITTEDSQLGLLSDKIVILPLNDNFIKTECKSDKCFLVLAKINKDIDPVLSQQAVSEDKNFIDFHSKQAAAKLRYQELLEKIKSSQEFKAYKLYWEDESIQILQSSRTK